MKYCMIVYALVDSLDGFDLRFSFMRQHVPIQFQSLSKYGSNFPSLMEEINSRD